MNAVDNEPGARLSILFVTQKFPFPLDNGGNVRSFNILKALARQHAVTLLATDEGDISTDHVTTVQPLCREILRVPVTSKSYSREALCLLRSEATGVPFVILRHARSAVMAAIRATFSERAYDVVHYNHLDTTLYDKAVPPGVRRVLDQHNVVTNQVRTTLSAERRRLRRAILHSDLGKITAFETTTCNAMNLCMVCSDTDEAGLRSMGVSSRIAVVPNGADLDYFTVRRDVSPGSTEMTFVGALDYDPCEQGLWYFYNEIFPLIRTSVPNARLTAVGRNPSARLRCIAASDARFVLTGRVEDVRPYVQRAGAFVVPLLSGSGTRLKIIEAMAMGVPVVSTSIGAQGIAAIGGTHLAVADTPDRFAASVAQVLRDPVYSADLAGNARRLVEQRYGWSAVETLLRNAYAQLSSEPCAN